MTAAATFLPVDKEAPRGQDAAASAMSCTTILIVDDEIQNRRLLEVQLRPEGYVTRTAASGEEALAVIAHSPPDLILLDIMMPGMDGYQVAGLLKADPATSSIPIIMVTAQIDRGARLAGLAAGAEEFLTKPVDRAELMLRVRNLLRLKAFGDFLQNYSVTLEQQVRARTRELTESERRFTNMLGSVDLVSVMLDRQARITYCNKYLLRLSGWREEDVIGRDWFEHFVPPGRSDVKDIFAALLANKSPAVHNENDIVTRSGERRLIRWNHSLIRSEAGEVTGIASIGEDITESKRSEVRIKRLNRVYAVLSGINTLIVRVRDLDELYREACQIAIDAGGFRMAHIELTQADGPPSIPAAAAGEDQALIDELREILRSPETYGKTMVARAIKEGRHMVSNDARTDHTLMMASKYKEAGIRAIAALPLIVGQEVRGVWVLYSGDAEFFDDEEMKLLTGLAGDIALAIDHIGKQALLDYLAYYDSLTGLANRTLFLERVGQAVSNAASGGFTPAVFLIDLERFKAINDSLGRAAGDHLLRQVAELLTVTVGDAVKLARLGADRFAMMLPDAKTEGDVAMCLEAITGALLGHHFRLDDTEFRIAAKVGVAVFPGDGSDADALFRNAEAALKKAQASGERYLFHTQKMTEAVAGKLTLENQLRQALDNDQFVLHYQPKVSLASGKLTGGEALIRWNDPSTGLVPPGRFIPVLEETGLIHEVGRWALRKALQDYRRCKAEGLDAVRIAVNVSPLQLRHRGFVDEIAAALGTDAGAGDGLELEITESLIMEDVRHSIAILEAIRAMGVTIAIDDFGTGFSSLSYLARLPVDTLKIDRSFVVDMTAGEQGLALVSTIINLAHSLKLKVVAEGVETEEQSRLLALLGCDEMQGFLFSKPRPGDEYERLFLTRSASSAWR